MSTTNTTDLAMTTTNTYDSTTTWNSVGEPTAWERREWAEADYQGYVYLPEEDGRLCWAS